MPNRKFASQEFGRGQTYVLGFPQQSVGDRGSLQLRRSGRIPRYIFLISTKVPTPLLRVTQYGVWWVDTTAMEFYGGFEWGGVVSVTEIIGLKT